MPSSFKILVAIFLFHSYLINAQTFTGTGGSIPDNAPAVYFTQNITTLSPSVLNANFGLLSICIDVTHTYDADLIITLVAPDGTEVILANQVGGDGNSFINTCFTQSATANIQQGTAPFTGNFKPIGSIGNINNGQASNGIWKLKVQDVGAVDTGSVTNWAITFGANPPVPFHLSHSNLPIVIINTQGQTIQDSPSQIVKMGIINNANGINHDTDPLNDYNQFAKIQIRGSSSQMFPKKSFGLELCDTLGFQIDSAVMGMPAEHDFILSASYTDKSFLRNTIAYTLWDKTGHYGCRYKHCELIINGEYQGVYIFTEKIKRDEKRVNISKLDSDDNAGDSLTGGYIIKVDKTTGAGGGAGWTSNYPPLASSSGQVTLYQYEYPSVAKITLQQKNYIHAYVDTFENVINSSYFADTAIGWRKYASSQHFIDYFFVNELSKNVDGYRLSSFLYKDKHSKGGKLKVGPVWDYDIAFGNANYCEGSDTTGWAYNFGNVCGGDGAQIPYFWGRLMQDTSYKNEIKCRWNYLREHEYSDTAIMNYIDSMSFKLDTALQRNFNTWQILGVYVWPEPTPLSNTYIEEVTRFKQWVKVRLKWLDANMPGKCWPPPVNTSNLVDNTFASELNLYPNPTNNNMVLEYLKQNTLSGTISITDVTGKLVKSVTNNNQSIGKQNMLIDLTDLQSGLYFLNVMDGKKCFRQKFVKL